MSVDPNWKPDPVKVAELIADHEADVEAQRLIVEKLRDLVDDEERELTRRERRVEEMREAWARHGVELPRPLFTRDRRAEAPASTTPTNTEETHP